MQFTLTIELGNDGMQFYSDITDAVISTIDRIRAGSYLMSTDRPSAGDGGKIRDINGNTVGEWNVTSTPVSIGASGPVTRF